MFIDTASSYLRIRISCRVAAISQDSCVGAMAFSFSFFQQSSQFFGCGVVIVDPKVDDLVSLLFRWFGQPLYSIW